MKVAVSSTGSTLDAAIDPRFGRCQTFLLVETDDLGFEAVANGSFTLGGGAGIQAALLVAQRGAKAVLTGNCGPNAHQTLTASGIQVVVGCSGTVRDAVSRFAAGALEPAPAPNVAPHAGMGRGAR
ncbi:MAG: NifB/NifX family molybdenum-iron cluster-binding protein [Acidobacteriota bacterium]